MIENLKHKNLKEAAKIYNKGLKKEVPMGYASLGETVKHLSRVKTFVYKEDGKIKGLICFIFENKNIKIDFICSTKHGRSIGKTLMNNLADFSLKKKIKFIYSKVSAKDRRAVKFYASCGFKKYGKYKKRKGFILYKVRVEPQTIKETINLLLSRTNTKT